MSIKFFNIIPGLNCTMACQHCATNSSPTHKNRISDFEKELLIKELNNLKPPNVILTGGEVALYKKDLLDILNSLVFPFKTILTTNGFSAKNLKDVDSFCGSIKNLSLIQLSFDRFHGQTLESVLPFLFKNYCFEKKIDFVLVACLSQFSDIDFAVEAKSTYDCDVIFQKIEGSGRAYSTNSEFRYDVFDNSVLSKTCPNIDTLSFIPQKGFSHCCANNIFNNNWKDVSFYNLDQLYHSSFYIDCKKSNFHQRLRNINFDEKSLSPRMTSPCNLCEFIETLKRKLNVL